MSTDAFREPEYRLADADGRRVGRALLVRDQSWQLTPPVVITRAGPDASCKWRELAIMPVICPTCQIVYAGSRMRATARLLCMGLFSIFLAGWCLADARPE